MIRLRKNKQGHSEFYFFSYIFVVFTSFFDFFNLAYARLVSSNSANDEGCILHIQKAVEQKHEVQSLVWFYLL